MRPTNQPFGCVVVPPPGAGAAPVPPLPTETQFNQAQPTDDGVPLPENGRKLPPNDDKKPDKPSPAQKP